MSVEGEQWARQRKLLNPAFATSALNNLVPVFARNADTLLSDWEEKADGKQVKIRILFLLSLSLSH